MEPTRKKIKMSSESENESSSSMQEIIVGFEIRPGVKRQNGLDKHEIQPPLKKLKEDYEVIESGSGNNNDPEDPAYFDLLNKMQGLLRPKLNLTLRIKKLKYEVLLFKLEITKTAEDKELVRLQLRKEDNRKKIKMKDFDKILAEIKIEIKILKKIIKDNIANIVVDSVDT